MSGPLHNRFRGIVCDLDGVVYRSHEAIPHAVQALEAVREAGVAIVYATNNAGRQPSIVAAQLRDLGLDAPDASVINSSMAGAAYLAQRFAPDCPVLAIGGEGVAVALVEAGLRPVRRGDTTPPDQADQVAVLQGYGPEVSWRDLAEAAYAIQRGATWVATNLDSTLPTNRGIAPGNGSLVAAVRAAVAIEPIAVGKPQTPLYELCAARLGTGVEQTLAIGDRLDTDIVGANRAGMPSLMVTTGVHHVDDLAAADESARPTYLAVDLRELLRTYIEPSVCTEDEAVTATCSEAYASYREGERLTLRDGGCPNTRLRAVVSLLWTVRDARNGVSPAALGIDADEWRRVGDWLGGEDGDALES